ncbi:YdcF family protein [Paludicola sp. MB14-C6]|uniref:YdcF family protein n=1 Tax=Paludihabitans sp. MB14-C6 TaxID=3070656 RepID=UPI0027DD6F0D|nr:YdcF family protein [Paludicola sp. MB14-C6]WMJ23930.1 YdcF family protein [Paludicola sp. MB14-C6]
MNQSVKAITDFIFVENEPQKCDAIMVIGGSNPELGEKAAELWKCGYAPLIFVGGGVSIKTGKFPGPKAKRNIYSEDYKTEFDFFMDVLLKNGVPIEAITGENRSGYTRQNAFYARKKVDEMQYKISKAILICKSFHARRSLMFYQLAFPKTEFLVVPIICYDICKDNWFTTEYGVQRVMGELSRCGNQFVDDYVHLRNT